MNSFVKLSCLATIALSMGCAHQLRFQVVDDSSGAPIPSVNVKSRQYGSFYYFEHKPKEHDVGLTDTNGFIAVDRVGMGDVCYFSALGYRGATAGFIAKNKIGISPYPPQNVDTMYLEQSVVDYSTNPVVIRLKQLVKE